jgi:hypothetical protein
MVADAVDRKHHQISLAGKPGQQIQMMLAFTAPLSASPHAMTMHPSC